MQCTNRMKIIKFIVEYKKHTGFYVQSINMKAKIQIIVLRVFLYKIV
jgi:hypothetical protein